MAGEVQIEIARLRQLIGDLDEAIASGAKSVLSNGERLEFQDTKAMMFARDDYKRQLASLVGNGRSPWRAARQIPTMRW